MSRGACQLATSLHEPASTQFVVVMMRIQIQTKDMSYGVWGRKVLVLGMTSVDECQVVPAVDSAWTNQDVAPDQPRIDQTASPNNGHRDQSALGEKVEVDVAVIDLPTGIPIAARSACGVRDARAPAPPVPGTDRLGDQIVGARRERLGAIGRRVHTRNRISELRRAKKHTPAEFEAVQRRHCQIGDKQNLPLARQGKVTCCPLLDNQLSN